MKKLWSLLILSIIVLNPSFVSAHGDEGKKDHTEHQGMMMHHKGGEEMQKMHAEHAATLREAASALQASRPDLAAKLEGMAKMHEDMHEGMES